MRVLFIYIGVGVGFSGQAKASELIVGGLRFEGVATVTRLLPWLDRSGCSSTFVSGFLFLCKLLCAYGALLFEKLPVGGAIHLSLGLTRFSLLRDGIALCCAKLFSSRSIRSVVALHGSVFTSWSTDSLDARVFRAIVGLCDVVTCVGASHARSLQALGVPADKVEIVPNVCEYDGVDELELIEKQRQSGSPVELLFLSSLTDTKGYPEYLEALELIADEPGVSIHAVLCGPIMMDAYRKRFLTQGEAESWIREKVAKINQSERVQVEWIPGARGNEKRELFERAQVFVLPTQYPVEAQPLVVLEAMAHGCAVVTTDVGELPSTVDSGCAVIVPKPTARTVQSGIQQLVRAPELRQDLALAGLARFRTQFNRDAYVQRWHKLLLEDCA